MRMIPLALTLALTAACREGDPAVLPDGDLDTGSPASQDSEGDAEEDSEVLASDSGEELDQEDSEAPEVEILVSGVVHDESGAPMEGVNVQICGFMCIAMDTDSEGSFSVSGPPDIYKVDILGESLDDYHGRMRVHADMTTETEKHFDIPLQIPDIALPQDFPSEKGRQTLSLGDMTLSADPSQLSPNLGWEEFGWSLGRLESPPDYWGVQAEIAVVMMSMDATISGPVEITFPPPAKSTSTAWDVLPLDDKGKVADSLGTATLNSLDEVVTMEVSPSSSGWLLLVPLK